MTQYMMVLCVRSWMSTQSCHLHDSLYLFVVTSLCREPVIAVEQLLIVMYCATCHARIIVPNVLTNAFAFRIKLLSDFK